MKRRLPFLLTFCWLLTTPAFGQRAPRPLALTRVTVVDATGGPARPDMTVVIEGGRIAAVGRSGGVRIPRGARVVDARGKFLIPGLWDAHTHHQASGAESLPLFVANGVTATRDMGSDLEFILNLRRGVEAGAVPGPRIVAAGPMLDDAPKDWPFRLRVTDAAGARDAVRLLRSKGVDFVKVHARLPREAYLAAADEAKRLGVPFAGHVPGGVSLAEAAAAGQKSVEHLSEYGLLFECAGRPGVTLAQVVEAYSPEKCAALFDLFKRHGTRHTPTLAALHVFSKSPAEIEADLRARGVLRYAGPTLLRFWTESERLSPPPPEEVRRELARMAAKSLEVVGEMNRRGVRLLAGCDALVPGFCLHDELELLVRAGLSPMEALQAATRNPAELAGRLDQLGTVEPNKLADLVLLDADPLADIRHTRRVRAVVLNGRYIPKAELQRMLSRPRERR
ncbi:MAG TPA: amidohydrolase family protein [Pyrinomonadaceae bacterium]|nr:amidohydrolase family protein [Pyrinomonadaceae bacterium]